MLPYGAEKIEDSLQISLMTENYRFSSRIERLLVKYIMEMVITTFVKAVGSFFIKFIYFIYFSAYFYNKYSCIFIIIIT